jgi:large subunit ribosomal protein L18
MARKKAKPVLYKRKRQGKTDYKKRLRVLLSGKVRLVVRLTNTKIIAQLVSFDVTGDTVIMGIDSSLLRAKGWNYSLKNHPAAYLTGFAIAKIGSSKVSGKIVLDTGRKTPRKGGRIYSFLKGAIDGGLDLIHGSEEIFATNEVMSGKHIELYAQQLSKDNNEAFTKKFSASLKKSADPKEMVATFEKIKASL